MINSDLLAPWPYYEEDESLAALQTLQSGKVNYWTGELGKAFENAYAQHTKRKHGIALSNGTVALELALRAFNIGPGDEVIVASRSYVASASCVLVVGATPVFADVDLNSGNISASAIAPLIGTKTKAIIPVHIGGLPCDMPDIMQLARTHELIVIEDCAQAHGASIAGRPVGGWGDAAIFSFCQDKIISTGGEGGMLVLDNIQAYKTAWAYKDIGRDYDAVYNQQHPPGFRWLTHSVGSNFRMTEFQSAIGLKQLEKLPGWVARRQQIAQRLQHALSAVDWIHFPTSTRNQVTHSYYRTYGLIQSNRIQPTDMHKLRNMLMSALSAAGVPCFSGSCAEIYLERAFAPYYDGQRRPNAQAYAERAFCLLSHHTITDAQVEIAVSTIHQVLDSLHV